MPFTSVTGASSVIKPGVVTSSTRPSAPYVGQLIFETDTNRLAVYNGSSWIMLADADTPPGLELVKTQTIGTAVSSVTVSDVFSSTYDNYKITLVGGDCSANCFLRLQLGSATNSYVGTLITAHFSTGAYNGAGSGGTSSFLYAGSGRAGAHLMMNCDVFAPNLAKFTSMNAGQVWWDSSASFGFSYGQHEGTSQFTAFTITPSTGTLTGGTIRVYGYRNS